MDTGRKLNVHKTFVRCPERLMYVQFTSCVYGVYDVVLSKMPEVYSEPCQHLRWSFFQNSLQLKAINYFQKQHFHRLPVNGCFLKCCRFSPNFRLYRIFLYTLIHDAIWENNAYFHEPARKYRKAKIIKNPCKTGCYDTLTTI